MDSSCNRAEPAIVELVLGVQFSPLIHWTQGHYGLVWEKLGRERWPVTFDAPPLDDRFESFDAPSWTTVGQTRFQIGPMQGPLRFAIQSADQSRLVQLQPSRLHLNWRKREADYPGFQTLAQEFHGIVEWFRQLVESLKIGPIQPNQWELTYVNVFPRDHAPRRWSSPLDWPKVLPGLFSELFDTGGTPLALENRAAEWTFEIKPRRGRLFVMAKAGVVDETGAAALIMQSTARGPLGEPGSSELRESLDLAHEVALEAFQRITGLPR